MNPSRTSFATLPCIAVVIALAVGCSWDRDTGPVPQELLDCRSLTSRAIKAAEYGNEAAAEKLLAQAVQTCPTDIEARRHYAEALWRAGRLPEAADQFDEALTLAGPDAALLTRRAELHADGRDVDRGLAGVESALDIDPRLPSAWLLRARLHRAAGQPQLALTDYCRALALDPEHREALLETVELRCELAELQPHGRAAQQQQALASLHALLETYPHDQEPQHVLALSGRVYQRLGRHADAAAAWQLAAQRGPETPELLHALAEAQLQSGRPYDALAALSAAEALAPTHPASPPLRRRIEIALSQPRETR